MRDVAFRYRDPLDEIWLSCAERLGFEVKRSAEVFVSVADGVLTIGAPETLDADDCFAQMIFHEFCHAIVQGPENFDVADWGLDNMGDDDVPQEWACLRLQAELLRRRGLRWVFAPTTDHRTFYDTLPEEPIPEQQVGEARDITMAREALARVAGPPWGDEVLRALDATQKVVAAVAPFAPEGSLLGRYRAP